MLSLLILLACTTNVQPGYPELEEDTADTADTVPVFFSSYRPPPGFYIAGFKVEDGEYTVTLSKPGREVVIEACHPDLFGVPSTTFPESTDGVIWSGTESYFSSLNGIDEPLGWEVKAVSNIGILETELYGENCGDW
jgi:hypothetical protein